MRDEQCLSHLDESLAFPPIKPTIAPNPIFQVVVQVSNKLICNDDGLANRESPSDITSDKIVSAKTVWKIHLNVVPDIVCTAISVRSFHKHQKQWPL